MKKLIIVAAIAAGALVSQAASFDWQTSSKAYSIADATVAAGLAAGTTYGVGNKNADSMSNQITSRSAVWTYLITLTSGSTTDTLTGTLGSGDFGSRYINTSLSSTIWDSATSESPVNVNYSIVLTGTLTDGLDKSWTITSDTITGSMSYAGVGDITFTTAAASSWSTAGSSGVPEPSSGLLMLVGLAGLALRRRRA